MTMVAMPGGRTSEMPATNAGRASAAVGKDAGTAVAGQFADVLGQRAQVDGRPATVREADEADRPSRGKRAEARGPGRKDEAEAGPSDGMKAAGVMGGAGPVVGNSALPVDAAPTSDAEAAIGPEIGFAALVGLARDAGGKASSASAGVVEEAETGGVGEVHAGAEEGASTLKDVSTTGDAAAGSAMGAHVESGLPPKVVTDMVAATSGAPLAGMLTASAAAVSGAAVGAVAAAASASTGSVKQQGSGGKGIHGKASGEDRRSVAEDAMASAQGQDGRAKIDGGGGAQTGLTGENRRGQHDARPIGKGTGGAAETTGRDGVASDGRSSGPAQPAVSPMPVQALAERMLPVTAVPVEASRGVPAIDPKAADVMGGAGSLGTAAAGLAEADRGSGVADAAAPLTSVGAARLLKTVAGSELRVGTQSADLGAVTIRTVLGRDQMEAHISFENERMGSALSAHLLGGSLEDRLGQSLGVRTSVTLSPGSDAGTGQSGREAAREAMTGQFGGQTGSGNGSGREGSGRYGAAAADLGSFGGSSRGAGLGVGRSMPYGGSAAMEGRLDVRV